MDQVELQPTKIASTTDKKILIALLLWFFLGTLSAHRFYAGRIKSAVFQLITPWIGLIFILVGVGFSVTDNLAGMGLSGILFVVFYGGFFIWLLVDLICILMGKFRDRNGSQISQWT
jgi:hypothetical protein